MKDRALQLKAIWESLDERIDELNRERRSEGMLGAVGVEVRLLGQMCLLTNPRVSAILHLAQTADVDPFLQMDSFVKEELKRLLAEVGLAYDEDSTLIWIPEGAKFEPLFNLTNLKVLALDPESALVSKAVKAPEKNRVLIREALASGQFAKLADRILKASGKLENFL
jgi:hypothetical protein